MGAIFEDFKAMTDVTEPRKFPSLAEREAKARDRVEAPVVDFSHVPPSQWDMHDRLLDWARWCVSRTKQGVSAGFGMHRSDNWDRREYGTDTVVPVNKDDAQLIAKAVAKLPEKHRQALHWLYLKRGRDPLTKARELAVSKAGLAALVIDARLMLINRGV